MTDWVHWTEKGNKIPKNAKESWLKELGSDDTLSIRAAIYFGIEIVFAMDIEVLCTLAELETSYKELDDRELRLLMVGWPGGRWVLLLTMTMDINGTMMAHITARTEHSTITVI